MRGEDVGVVSLDHELFRLTPACAGKTCRRRRFQSTAGAHPRMRGEDAALRRRRQRDQGLTPACAGKTIRGLGCSGSIRAHPRMRGEDAPFGKTNPDRPGSPPHARGRLRPQRRKRDTHGLTPACAGKTDGKWPAGRSLKAHPRMRGEDVSARTARDGLQGSPPHARGRREEYLRPFGRSSAHTRMRGEDFDHVFGEDGECGSPPHARGRP